MDIKKIAAKKEALLVLRAAHGNELEDENGKVSVTICSPATQQWRDAQAEYQAELAEGTDEGTARAIFCAACTISSQNLDYGASKGAFSDVYHDQDLGFIKNQVFVALQNWGKFSPSAKVN